MRKIIFVFLFVLCLGSVFSLPLPPLAPSAGDSSEVVNDSIKRIGESSMSEFSLNGLLQSWEVLAMLIAILIVTIFLLIRRKHIKGGIRYN